MPFIMRGMFGCSHCVLFIEKGEPHPRMKSIRKKFDQKQVEGMSLDYEYEGGVRVSTRPCGICGDKTPGQRFPVKITIGG